MAEHSPEPWSVDADGHVCDGKGKVVVAWDHIGIKDANRIAACVNACKGIDTDWLEKYGRAAFVRRIVFVPDDHVGIVHEVLNAPLEASEKLIPMSTCKECGGFLYPREEEPPKVSPETG